MTIVLVLSAAALSGCNQAPPRWDALIAGRIVDQYPSYRTTVADGTVLVERPGQTAFRVDVAPVAQFCQRGPRDCNYAIDQLLLELAPLPGAAATRAAPAAP